MATIKGVKLTPREVDIMGYVVAYGDVSISNWDEVVKGTGATTVKYARDTWTNIKRKLSASTTIGKRGNGTDAGDHADDEAEAEIETPSKKKPAAKKAGPPRKRKIKAEPTEEDEDVVERPLKKTKRATSLKARTPRKTAAMSEVKSEDVGDQDANALDQAAPNQDALDQDTLVQRAFQEAYDDFTHGADDVV